MSIILRCLFGVVVDHEQAITLSCGKLPIECRPSIFYTLEPYGKNVKSVSTSCSSSSLEKSSCDGDGHGLHGIPSKKRKRKRKHSLNTGEINALEHHEKIRENIQRGVEALQKFDQWQNYFKPCNSEAQEKGETSDYLQAAFSCSEFLSAVISDRTLYGYLSLLHPVEDVSYQVCDVVNRTVHNEKDHSMLISISGANFVLPAQSKFFLSDITHLKRFTKSLDCAKYDMIVIDPPWENKSVKRGTKYSFLPLWQIKNLPVCDLAANMALVGVWVTNKQKYRKFVIEELFPSWSCKLVAEWHWVKVTRKGEMVFDLDSTHKKPYEPLLIGQFVKKIQSFEPRTNIISEREEFNNGTDETTVCPAVESNVGTETGVSLRSCYESSERSLPQHQVICSVPCTLHSRKPPLNDIFREYLPDNAKCIELFARNLLPNWTSWGNEALKYQHLDYFQSRKR